MKLFLVIRHLASESDHTSRTDTVGPSSVRVMDMSTGTRWSSSLPREAVFTALWRNYTA